MLRADSRFWLVNNREIWSRILRLTSSAWIIKTKERHWWRHNGDSDRRPLSSPLRYRPRNIVFIRWFRTDYCGSWDFKAAETLQNVTNIVLAWGKFVTPCLLPRIRVFIHTKHCNTTLGLRPRVVLKCCVWINSRIRVSKQGVTNNIYI